MSAQGTRRHDGLRLAFYDNVGLRIRAVRETIGRSQAQLADALGIAQSAIVLFEAGERQPSLFDAVRIAEALGVSLESLTTVPKLAAERTAP